MSKKRNHFRHMYINEQLKTYLNLNYANTNSGSFVLPRAFTSLSKIYDPNLEGFLFSF